MDERKKTLRHLIFSSNKSFKRKLLKILHRCRFGEHILQIESYQELKDQVSQNDILHLDEFLISENKQFILSELFDHLSKAKIYIFLYCTYKHDLPGLILDNPEIFYLISRTLSRDEIEFQLSAIEYRIENSSTTIQKRQEKYLETIIHIQNLLLVNSTRKDILNEVVELIGTVSQASRVSVFENKYDYQEKLLMSQRYEWSDNGVSSQTENPLFSLLPYQPNFERWENQLSAGEYISGNIEDLPNSERPFLSTHGIKKLLLLPILIKGEFWGFIMLSICNSRELWTSEEISLLKSATAPITSFLEVKLEERRRDISDGRLRRIFESSNIGLVLATKDGNLKSFNPAFATMLGYGENELKNLNFRVFTHPDDLKKELILFSDLLEGKTQSYLIEKRYIKKGGKQIWVKVNVSAFSKEKGIPESLIGIVENISKEKETEKALLESEDRYKKLSDLSLEGIVLHQNGIAIDCNEKFLDMSGYTRNELIGINLINLLADRKSQKIVQEKIQSNDINPFEVFAITKTGISIPVELENRVVDYKGETIRVTVFRDITERKKNEQEIRKLNTAIDQSPSSIVITNKDGDIEYVNKSFCEITGYSVEEAVGQNPRILKTESHSVEYYKNLWDSISSGKTWNGVFRNKAKSGAFYWEKAVISPIFNEYNQITHYLAIKENITKEKKAQEALKISEERHRIISKLTNDFVYSARVEKSALKLDWGSGSLLKVSGYTIRELALLDNGWYSTVLKEDLKDIILPAIAKFPKEKVLNIQYRIRTKKGQTKWVIDRVQLIKALVDKNVFKVIGAIQDITQRMEANLELDQSKRYLDNIIDNLPIGLQIFDEQGFTARINETQKKLSGSKDLTDGKNEFNILNDPFSKSTGAEKVYRDVYENKKTINHEIELKFHADNESDTKKGTISINEIIFPILKDDGNVHSVISLSSDITKRVNAENALKASEMHQKTLLKIIPDLIFVLNYEGVFKDVYTEDSQRLLIPADQFLGKPFSDVFPGELSEKFYKSLKIAIKTNEMQSYTYELVINGNIEYYESRLLTGEENEVIAIIRDITDSVNAEKALKESEEKFRELAERTQDALVLLSITNEILYVSPNVYNILGISPESYTKNPFDAIKLIHKDDKRWVIPELNNYRKGKQLSLDIQFRVIPEHQKQKWIWYRESTVFDASSNPTRYAAVITDITENKAAEEELKLAKEEAEKANRSKSAFLANISHEIRTPMNAVLGFSDLLYSRIQDPVLKEYLNSIKSSGNTLLNLLNDILDLSKIEAEKMTLIPSPINLFDVFDEIKHIFSLKALEKGLDYSFDIDKTLPASLLLDELRLKQVLLNLVDNAIKFTDKGKINIIVKRINSNNNFDTVDILIIVEDTGIGIPHHLQGLIFESFRQQDDKDKKKFQGTGLGLAITKRLVELFNGIIQLKSEPGKGSRFEVVLPQIKISKQPEKAERHNRKKLRFEDSVLKEKTIVLIDQDRSNRELVKEVFYNSKSDVIEGESIENVCDGLPVKIDLIIMEIKNVQSLETDLRALKNSQELSLVPKIGLSSLSEIEGTFSKEFVAILTKPIHLPKLVEIVSNQFQLNDFNIENRFLSEKIDKSVVLEVIKLLEKKHHKKWEAALLTSSFSEIEDFAHGIKHLGVEYNLTSLQSFSDVLVMHVKNFDIDNMNDVLKSFPSLIKELKTTYKQVKK